MAGESNYGGNGSVYWRTQHRENGRPVNLKKRGNPKCEDAATPGDHTVDIGDPHFVKGRDPHGNPSSFEVELRFDTSPDGSGAAMVAGSLSSQEPVDTAVRAARVAAIQSELEKLKNATEVALEQIKGGATEATVKVNVPAILRHHPPQDGWEVTVRWD
jgi:hypothetical protein